MRKAYFFSLPLNGREMEKKKLKVYLASPGIFSFGDWPGLKRMVKKNGFEPVHPFDNRINFSQPKGQIADDIFHGNLKLIEKADIVIADLNRYRGSLVDDGTSFEIGYAYNLGKPIYGYLKPPSIFGIFERSPEKIVLVDNWGDEIAMEGYPVNLMIAKAIMESKGFYVHGGLEELLQEIKKRI